ncbi:triple tyrosine motif-containing protein [Allomuricauda sp. SCSIO 65647]|uniref:helix-turn-helix and ligand-binding sensor domain-containing protein n=1 Tax=Allomuricauda sp. SCSIO 65647 TaxID=2908843 RepID=UPI001F1EEB08|nr:triple tyrosine motif-containing protein [Muricauda sp. SCSIO 65647]UJH67534.1 LuxR C-terminal-related transcriptional regulator [Muricauda sp. SCSIO 65647]
MRFYIILLFFVPLSLIAQELPPIQVFYPYDYNGENQNWAISQSSEKLIYVANSKGLIEFNGASFKLYPSINETIMRSVNVIDDRIYTGCFMEFGYWEKNDLGILKYTSLSKKIGIDLLEDEEFWNIIAVDEYIVFQSLKRIYIYDVRDGSVSTIDSKSTITKMFKIGQGIYFQRMGEGVFKIESGRDILVFDDEIVKKDEVIQLFGNEKDVMVLTKQNGFYRLSDGSLVQSKNFPNDLLSNLSLYDGIQLKDESYVLGSISNGMIHLSKEGELLFQIDQNTGLSNNTVLSVFEDADSNIWLGLDYGISYVNLDAPYRVFDDTNGILGSVYVSAIHNDNLYLGTNQGLFYKPFDGSDDYRLISGTQGQVWCLEEIDGTLFCGHNTGTFLIRDNKAQKIASVQGTWQIAKLADRPNLLLQGNYDGLYVLEKSNGSWKLRNKIEGFANSSRYFETLGNKIFVNHEYNGVFEVVVDDTFSKAGKVTIDTSIKGSNSGLAMYNGDLLYAYKDGIFTYDDEKFVRDSLLSNIYDEHEYESGKLLVDENDNRLWVFSKSNINYVSPVGLTNTLKIRSVPLTKEVRNGILGYENIMKLDDRGNYLLGKTSGYFIMNTNEVKPKKFHVHISEVSNWAINTNKSFFDKKLEGSFDNDENNLEFSFYAPEYNKYINTQYQYRLEGMYDDWSDWSEKATVLYENLPFGDYEFQVKGKIGNALSDNTASYSFKVAKPWYLSTLMISLYALGAILGSIMIHYSYKRHYHKRQQKLIERNKREMELAKAQNEKEIIKIKNEQLKTDFKNKSSELAASTLSIIRKNELLSKAKEQLLSYAEDKDSVKPIINIIDKSLNQNDDWELFKEAFNNADRKFLKKLKKAHPNLSPNDIRLCAYLRLNLSSKEIAPLFNISARSVEIKRYRLRKKMNLSHDANLVNYILKL